MLKGRFLLPDFYLQVFLIYTEMSLTNNKQHLAICLLQTTFGHCPKDLTPLSIGYLF